MFNAGHQRVPKYVEASGTLFGTMEVFVCTLLSFLIFSMKTINCDPITSNSLVVNLNLQETGC